MKSGKNAFHDTLKREKFSSILLPNKLGHYHHYNMELRLRLKLDEAEINTRRIDGIQCRKLSDGHKLDLKFLKDSFCTAGGQKSLWVWSSSLWHIPPFSPHTHSSELLSLRVFTVYASHPWHYENRAQKISDAIIIPSPYFLPSAKWNGGKSLKSIKKKRKENFQVIQYLSR